MFVCTQWGRGWYLWIPEEGIRAPGTSVTDGRELPSECQELNPGSCKSRKWSLRQSQLSSLSLFRKPPQLTLSSHSVHRHSCFPYCVSVNVPRQYLSHSATVPESLCLSRPHLLLCIARAGLRCVTSSLLPPGNYLGL